MKKYLTYILFISTILTVGCSKDTSSAEMGLALQFLSDKTWFLDYTETTTAKGTSTKIYVGQSTYFINFLRDLSTSDSDGLTGTYTVEKINNQLQIHVQAKTGNANSVEYIYNIESVGASNLILNYVQNGQSVKQYFSNKK
jgi:hypothetical protein